MIPPCFVSVCPQHFSLFYVVHVLSKEGRRVLLSRTSCYYYKQFSNSMFVRHEVLTTLMMKLTLFRNVTLSGRVDVY
jgi:hypothetical protein